MRLVFFIYLFYITEPTGFKTHLSLIELKVKLSMGVKQLFYRSPCRPTTRSIRNQGVTQRDSGVHCFSNGRRVWIHPSASPRKRWGTLSFPPSSISQNSPTDSPSFLFSVLFTCLFPPFFILFSHSSQPGSMSPFIPPLVRPFLLKEQKNVPESGYGVWKRG